MRILIDTPAAWNSGYETHLIQFLSHVDSFLESDELIVYGHSRLLSKTDGLSKKTLFITDDNIPANTFKALMWRRRTIPAILKHYNPDVHLNLMGWMHHVDQKIARIGMNRNLQPFIPQAVNTLSLFDKEFYRLRFYKKEIISSYNKCSGVIFNSEYAKEIIEPLLKHAKNNTVIPHGVNPSFFAKPRAQKKTDNLKILYVSDFYNYKNQEVLIEAVSCLRKKRSLNLSLNLIGDINNQARQRLNRTLSRIDNKENWLSILKKVPNYELKNHFLDNDLFVFASSVESFGHPLIEAMAAGMPIACSNKRPMIDFLGKERVTFNEKSVESTANAIFDLVCNPESRYSMALEAYNRAQEFSYVTMTKKTIDYLRSF